MQILLLALDANSLEQLILNAQSTEDIVTCPAIQYRLQLTDWQALDYLLQSDAILKEALHPIHPLSIHPIPGARVHYNTVVRVSDVYAALNDLEVTEFIQAKHVQQIQTANIASQLSSDELLGALRVSFNQLQSFYYHAADHNLVIVALQGEQLFAASYF